MIRDEKENLQLLKILNSISEYAAFADLRAQLVAEFFFFLFLPFS